MEDLSRLKALEDNKLIDIVKNYRQYNYSEAFRNQAIELLKERGIDEEFLALTGNLENTTYTHAQNIYNQFKRNSKLAFILYSLMLISYFIIYGLILERGTAQLWMVILNWGLFLTYLNYMVRSMMNQINFYKVIKKPYSAGNMALYVIIGVPFYFMMYFYYRNQMKEHMQLIS